MAARASPTSNAALSLALAIVNSSNAPLVLLDGDLTVIAASISFCDAFQLDPSSVTERKLLALGAGEWNVPQLASLLKATASGAADIDAYEMDLKREGQGDRRLVLNAQKLDYGDAASARLLLTVSDVTDARIADKLKDDLLREKAVLLQELQHRVANSLQIIASVLLQSARRVQSDETRGHLYDAHQRVMSVAALQRQLAVSRLGDVELRSYFTELCQSIGASMIRNHNQLSLEVRSDEAVTTPDISMGLGLIVTELVINALKHAFPGRRKGKIMVDYQARGAAWTLSVSDNGVGMPKDPESAKSGLGTSIIQALAKQLNAQVEITQANPATTVSIVHRQIVAAVAQTATHL
jgi:two-component system, sensor histidine kinase PdtaS